MHSREEFDVLDRRLRHPALVNRECHDFAFGLEWHDNLDQFVCDRIEGDLYVPFNDFLGDLLRHDESEHFDEQLVEIGITLLGWQIHHRPRVAVYSEREALTC